MNTIYLLLTLLLSLFLGFTGSVYANEENSSKCYYQHEVNRDGVSKLVVLYEEASGESKVVKEARSRGIEVVYEQEHPGFTTRDYKYFSSLYLYYRDGEGMTVSCTPKSTLVVVSNVDAAWSEIYGYIQWHPLYREVENPSKESSLLHQFQCHAHFAWLRPTWNLEVEKMIKDIGDLLKAHVTN